MAEDFREMAKGLLEKEADPALLALCGREVEEYICGYCGVTALPEGAGESFWREYGFVPAGGNVWEKSIRFDPQFLGERA